MSSSTRTNEAIFETVAESHLLAHGYVGIAAERLRPGANAEPINPAMLPWFAVVLAPSIAAPPKTDLPWLEFFESRFAAAILADE